MTPSFVPIPHGRQTIVPHATHARHRHAMPYAAIVMRGGYVEAGGRGRWQMCAGDVLLHTAFDAHRDTFGSAQTEIFNLPLPFWPPPDFAAGRLRDPDEIMRCAEHDAVEASARLLSAVQAIDRDCGDWPDQLAGDLLARPNLSLAAWATDQGLRPETLSRGFQRVFGVPPARFRAEARARKAWTLLAQSTVPLAAIAGSTGFADQSHMTRSVVALTGRSPSAWRRQFGSRPPEA